MFADSVSAPESIQNHPFNHLISIQILELLFNLDARDTKQLWPSHVGIQDNETADKAAKEAVNELILNIKIPCTDLKT